MSCAAGLAISFAVLLLAGAVVLMQISVRKLEQALITVVLTLDTMGKRIDLRKVTP